MEEKNMNSQQGHEISNTTRGSMCNKEMCVVNRKLLPIKVLYFVAYAALACFHPYVLVFAKQLGLTSQESGTLFGVMPFLSFLAQIIIAMLADRWRKHKVILMLAFLIAGVFNVLIVAVPPRLHGDTLALKGGITVKCHTDLMLSLTYCGNGVPSHLWPGSTSINMSMLETHHVPSHLLPGSTNSTMSTLETHHVRSYLLPESTSVNMSTLEPNHVPSPQSTNNTMSTLKANTLPMGGSAVFCPHSVLEVMKAMTLRDASTQSTSHSRTCTVQCSNRPQTQSASVKNCLTNITANNNVSNTLFDRCVWVQRERLPETLHLRRLVKVPGKSDAIIDTSDAKAGEKEHNRCYDFGISSLLVDGDVVEAIHCDPEQELPCTVQCVVPSCPGDVSFFDLTFWLILVTHLIGNLAFAPILPMCDTACYGTLKDDWRKFGRQRVWGTIGWLVISVGTSVGVYLGNELNYALLFYVHGGLMMLGIATAYFVDIPSDTRCGNIFKNMRNILVLPKVMVLLLVALVFGVMFGATGFVLWYLEDLGAPPQIFGPYNVVGVLTEVPTFFLAGRLIRRFGPIPCLCVGVAAMSVRLTGYALLGDPWLALLVVTLNGVSMALVVSSATTYITWIAPRGMSATAQGLLGGVVFNLGRGTGVILTGWMMAAVGPRITFAVYAATGLTVSVTYALLHRCVFKDNSQPVTEKETESAGDGQVPDVDTQQPVEETDETSRPLSPAVDQQTVTHTLLPSVSPHPADDDTCHNTLLPSVSPHPADDDNTLLPSVWPHPADDHNTLLPSVWPHPADDHNTLLPSVWPHPADDDTCHNTLLPSVWPHPADDDSCHTTLLPSVWPHPADDDNCHNTLLPSVSPHPADDDNCHNTLLPSVSPHPADDDSCHNTNAPSVGDTGVV